MADSKRKFQLDVIVQAYRTLQSGHVSTNLADVWPQVRECLCVCAGVRVCAYVCVC